MKQSTNTITNDELHKWFKELQNTDIEIICAIYELINKSILEDVSLKEDRSVFVVIDR